jgi:uncharacterized membrane protein
MMNGLKIAFAVAFSFSVAAGVSPAVATTCDEAVAQCQIEGATKDKIVQKCQAAGAACHKTGRFVGPITGRSWKNIRRE